MPAGKLNSAEVLTSFGERIFGNSWGAGVGRLAGVHERTVLRIAAAAREGRDYRSAREVLAALLAGLEPIMVDLRRAVR